MRPTQQHLAQIQKDGLPKELQGSEQKTDCKKDDAENVRNVLYLEVLGNVQNPGNVERVLLIKVSECIGQVSRLYLPDSHENKLMVGMSCKEHC